MSEVARLESLSMPPIDPYERRIDYLRVSVTDRCNLRCRYCMPPEGARKLAHADILSYEELLRLVRIALDIGISKVRLTGGEPLVRKGIIDFCRRLSRLPGLKSLSLTSNGVLMEECARDLFEAGIHRVNISLDTIRREKFYQITGVDAFDTVWRGIRAAEEAGFYPIKLNVVAMRDMNEDEIVDLALLTRSHPYHVRFIEFMPVSPEVSWSPRHFVSADEIIARLQTIGPLEQITAAHTNGPARHFRWPDAPGVIGIISPISHHFCPTCNRIRLTADGKLRTCLFSDEEGDIKSPLRQGASDAELADTLRKAIARKPEKHTVQPDLFRKCQSRPMVTIGG
ncbi:MAG TPA: GTP 3',8-cyclase MoaA [Syntrophobacteria bacterium]|nr:GTP 3',8-cyclase MoaA [Syntrophobacteria bacterium]